jgi:hypothetical protein
MSFHWSDIRKSARIEAMKSAWEPGLSMSKLAAKLGTTRSAIAGMYHRHGSLLVDQPLNKRPEKKAEDEKTVIRVKRPVPPAVLRYTRDYGPGLPLVRVSNHQCKWPINDPEIGQEHLFCAMPAEGPYCDHHKQRSVRKEAA